MVTQGTIEEQIVSLHGKKRELADALLAEGDAGARFGVEDLLNLLRDQA
jgi:SNF2 family DNA or RNA helicase